MDKFTSTFTTYCYLIQVYEIFCSLQPADQRHQITSKRLQVQCESHEWLHPRNDYWAFVLLDQRMQINYSHKYDTKLFLHTKVEYF